MENRALGKSIAILHRREQKYMISKMKELGIVIPVIIFCFTWKFIQEAVRRKCVKRWQWMRLWQSEQ